MDLEDMKIETDHDLDIHSGPLGAWQMTIYICKKKKKKKKKREERRGGKERRKEEKKKREGMEKKKIKKKKAPTINSGPLS